MRLAEEQITLLQGIVSQTLGFAQAGAAPKPIDLVALAEAALRIYQHALSAKNIRVIKDLPGDLVAHVFTGKLLQVISNLIVNALDVLPNEDRLHLRLRKRAATIHFVVADNGGGIAAEHLGSLFRPFFTTKGDAGTGLGLALSKNIVERHRGTVRIRTSTRPGRSGTTFRISLPG